MKTREEILKQAIEKAVKNGYQIDEGWDVDPTCMIVWFSTNNATEPYSIIFSHEFAKAFWGEKEVDLVRERGAYISYVGTQPAWQYHLQQMVLEIDPISYLEKFI